ncbi:UNVERIFIED_CONTAM: hypothetical protein GTU68_016418 [Idotea baltica]|nr:hypothetical protein [Idotea baltica]
MVSFILQNLSKVEKMNLYATGTTGTHISQAGFEVTPLLSGPLGGDAQIATMVATGEIDMVIFFRDPLDKHPHEPDVQMLMRLCDGFIITLWLANRAWWQEFIYQGNRKWRITFED